MVSNGSTVEYHCTLCAEVLLDIKQIMSHKKLHCTARYVVVVKAKAVKTENNKSERVDEYAQESKHEKSDAFTCPCSQHFSTEGEYRLHRTSCESIKCHYCGILCNKYAMYGHMLFNHKGMKTFTCYLCGYTVNSSMKYVNHLHVQHEKLDNTLKYSDNSEYAQSVVTKNDADIFSKEIEQLSLPLKNAKVFKGLHKRTKYQAYLTMKRKNTARNHNKYLKSLGHPKFAKTNIMSTNEDVSQRTDDIAVSTASDPLSLSENSHATDGHYSENLEKGRITDEIIYLCGLCNNKFNSQKEFDSHFEVDQKGYLKCIKLQRQSIDNLSLDTSKDPLDYAESTINVSPTNKINSQYIDDNALNDDSHCENLKKQNDANINSYELCHNKFSSKKQFDSHREVCQKGYEKCPNDQPDSCTNIDLNLVPNSVKSTESAKSTNIISPKEVNSQYSKESSVENDKILSEDFNENEISDDKSCRLCSNKFNSEEDLDSHLEVCKIEKEKKCAPRICDICGKIFTRWLYLKRHLKTHQGVRNYLCHLCGKQTSASNHLKHHVRTVHNKDRRYKCHVCEKGFPTSTKLKRHMMWHTGQKPFKCELCNKQCIQKCNLQRHVCRPPV